jgi:hypothetical protein
MLRNHTTEASTFTVLYNGYDYRSVAWVGFFERLFLDIFVRDDFFGESFCKWFGKFYAS